MRVAIDQPGKDRGSSTVKPADRCRRGNSANIFIIAGGNDPPFFDKDSAIPPAAQRTKIRCVNENAANTESIFVLIHGNAYSRKHQTEERTGNLRFSIGRPAYKKIR